MKTLLIFFLLVLEVGLANAGEVDFFETLMRQENNQGISGDVIRKCDGLIEKFDSASYLCAFLLLEDEEFLRFIDRARRESNLSGLWDIDRIIYTNDVLQNIELSSEVRTIEKIEVRIFNLVLNSSSELFDRNCNILVGFYYSSDGYFREDLFYRLGEVYEKHPEISRCFESFTPAFRHDFDEVFGTDLSDN